MSLFFASNLQPLNATDYGQQILEKRRLWPCEVYPKFPWAEMGSGEMGLRSVWGVDGAAIRPFHFLAE